MRFANPAGLALLALAIPVMLHAHPAAAADAGHGVVDVCCGGSSSDRSARPQPWQRLRWSLLLLAQLLAVAGARARRRQARTGRGRRRCREHTVFIIDASGSMAATDGRPTASPTPSTAPSSSATSCPTAAWRRSSSPATRRGSTLTASADSAEFDARAAHDRPVGRPSRLRRRLRLAESLDTGGTPIGFVLLTDGGLTDTEERLLPPGTRVEQIGSDDTNRAITASHRRQPEHRAARPGDGPQHRWRGGHPDGARRRRRRHRRRPRTSRSGRGERPTSRSTSPSGDRVEAFLEGDDLLDADDHAFAVAKQASNVRVLLGRRPAVLGAVAVVDPRRQRRDDGGLDAADGYDLAIYSGVAVPDDPGAPFIAIAPPGGLRLPTGDDDPATATGEEIIVDGDVEGPAVTLVRTDDPLLHGIDLSEVAIATAQQVEVGGAEVLVAGEGAPLLVRGQFAGERFAYFAFDLRDSNLRRAARVPAARRAPRRPAQRHRVGRPRAHRRRPAARAAARRRDGHGHRRRRAADRDRAGRPGAAGPAPGIRRRSACPTAPRSSWRSTRRRDESELAPRGLTAPDGIAARRGRRHRTIESLLPWVL